jgi:hypothetical protein
MIASNPRQWSGPPENRAEAMKDATYLMWCGHPKSAYEIIVALCYSLDKRGYDEYDETLERNYVTFYQREPTSASGS